MSLAFPSAPTLNQQVTVAGALYVYNGVAWCKDTVLSGLKTVNGQSLLGGGNVIVHGETIGIFATTVALESAFPAAIHIGKSALVGASAPYTEYGSNGSVWQPKAFYQGLGIDVSQTGVVSNLSGTISNVTRVGNNITSYVSNGITYTVTYNGNGSVSTISDGVTTKTVTYDVSGSFVSFS